MTEQKIWDVAIIGSGPAGMAAALYAGRATLSVCTVESMLPGGQVANTASMENYPGFPDGVGGLELSQLMHKQALNWGLVEIYDEVLSIGKESGGKFTIHGKSGDVYAKTIILATGSKPRALGCPGEDEFRGRGVSYCAVCDGAFFRNKKVVVVGGGDSAVEEAIFLTRYASEVVIVHRRDELRAAKHIQEQAFKNEKISFEWSYVVDTVLGSDTVEGVRLKSAKTGETKEVKADGVFVYVGMIPNTKFLQGFVELDQAGYIVAGEDTGTSIPGVFAAGDVRTKPLRQVVTAVSDGAVAAMAAEHYLSK